LRMPENAIEHYRESWIPGRRQGPAGQSLKPIDGAASRFGCNARERTREFSSLEKRLKRVSAMQTAVTVMDGSGCFWRIQFIVVSLFRRVGLFLSETTE
jgi:hypothetical protein